MKRKTDIIMTSCAAAVVAAVVFTAVQDYRATKINKRIEAKADADIARIWKAAAIVDAKMKHGDYDGRTVDNVMEDFAFYQQVFNYRES